MIRQFLATTVENLRSFFSSLAGSERTDDSSTPRPPGPFVPKRPPQITQAPVHGMNLPPTPEPLRTPANRQLPRPAPVTPQAETQRRRLRQAGILPPGGADEIPVPQKSEPESVKPAADLAATAEQVSPEQAPAEQAPPEQAPARTSRRPARVPHLFPTQSVPVQPVPGLPADAPSPPAPEPPLEFPTGRPPDAEDAPVPPAENTTPEAEAPASSDDGQDGAPDGTDGPQPGSPAGAQFDELHALLESLLFVAGEPVAPAQMARTLDLDEASVVAGLRTLATAYTQQNRGLRIQTHRDKYQLVTAPGAAHHIERFLNLDSSSKLSGPALETLAVVAYRQPVTRSQVEAVRGVDCAAVLRSLAQRGLIEEVGRLDVPGRPILYGVTDLFMQHFGLTDLGELPPLEQTEADTLWAATALAELEGEAGSAATDSDPASAS